MSPKVGLFRRSNQPCDTHTNWLYCTEWWPRMSTILVGCCFTFLMTKIVWCTFLRHTDWWNTGVKTRLLSRWKTWARNREMQSWQRTSLWFVVEDQKSNLCHNWLYCGLYTKEQLILLLNKAKNQQLLETNLPAFIICWYDIVLSNILTIVNFVLV